MAWMAKADEPIAQLATRIPKELHRRLKLHCVTQDRRAGLRDPGGRGKAEAEGVVEDQDLTEMRRG